MAQPFTIFYRLEVSEQALGGIPLGFGIVVEGKPSELSCRELSCVCNLAPVLSCHMDNTGVMWG